MSVLKFISDNLRVLHKVKSVPTEESKGGFHYVSMDSGRKGVYVVSEKKVHKLFDTEDYYVKTEADNKLNGEVDTLNRRITQEKTELKELIDNGSALGVVKSYSTYAAMEADKRAPVGDDGQRLKRGQLVSVTEDAEASKNGLYRWNVGSWEYLKGLGDMAAYARKEELVQLAGDKTDVGNIFSIEKKAIRNNGAAVATIKGINCTDFIPIYKNSIIKGRGWTGAAGNDIAAVAFYDKEKKFIEAVGAGVGGYVDYSYIYDELPTGATYVRGTEIMSRGKGFISISVLSLLDDLDNRKVDVVAGKGLSANDYTNEAVEEVAKISGKLNAREIFTPSANVLNPAAKSAGVFVNPVTGKTSGHVGYWVAWFAVEPDVKHIALGALARWTRLAFYTANIEASFIPNSGRIYPSSPSASVIPDTGVVSVPVGARFCAVSYPNSVPIEKIQIEFGANKTPFTPYGSSSLNSVFAESLKADVARTKKMKVALTADGFHARSAYDDAHDLLIQFIVDVNGQLTPNRTFKGGVDLKDEDMMRGAPIHDLYDSTGPVTMPEYWHLGQQHGYEMCRINATHDKDESDVGSIWKDNLNREFTLVKVDGNSLYFNPKITTGPQEGKDIRSWKTPSDSNAITEMTHVSGALHNTPVTDISSKPRYSYKPIQKTINRKFLADGKPVNDISQPVYCDEFIATETIQVVNPVRVTQWFPELKYTADDWEMFSIVQSFVLNGLNMRLNSVLNVKYPLNFTRYGANQCRMLRPTVGYESLKSFGVIPKTLPQGGVDYRMSFDTSDYKVNQAVVFLKNSDSIENVGNVPERMLSFLKNGDDYELGFAVGFSLLHGLTANGKRGLYVVEGNGVSSQVVYFSPANGNKFYARVLQGASFADSLLPRGVYEVNYYLSYFNPSMQKNKVYWYKDGGGYVVYVHSEDAQANAEILLPEEMEGLSVKIIEKTEGATLLTEVIQNNKLYASFDSEANYIVLTTI